MLATSQYYMYNPYLAPCGIESYNDYFVAFVRHDALEVLERSDLLHLSWSRTVLVFTAARHELAHALFKIRHVVGWLIQGTFRIPTKGSSIA